MLTAQRQRAILSVLGPVLIDQSLRSPTQPGSNPTASADTSNIPMQITSRAATRKVLAPKDSRLNPDVLQWSAAYELDAAPVVAQRSTARVAVHGLGRTGALLAAILASAGVGSLLLCDSVVMRPEDLGAGTTGIASVGQRRARALGFCLQRDYPRLIVGQSTMRAVNAPAVDLAVVIAGTMLPSLSKLPHDDRLLPVLFTDSGVRIGPLVIPGLSICEACAWEQCDPTLRLVSPGEQFGHRSAVKPEASLAATTAGTVATQILMALDQINIPVAAENMLVIDLATGTTSQVPAKARPGCWCLGQQAA